MGTNKTELKKISIKVVKANEPTIVANDEGPKKSKSALALIEFGRLFMVLALIILLATTVFWSILGANLHSANADQSVNSLLFENSATFHNAYLPSAHSFLIKWPLFIAVKFFGYSKTSLITLTVLTSLVTIGFLALILYRIERRPLVFGTICLALASVLLLVPSVPYAGALLPANMAMLATRNIEYIFYIVSVILLVRAPRIKSWYFWSAAVLLSLLIASDKLFAIIGLGGALVAFTIYAIAKRWTMVTTSVNWLIVGLVAVAGGFGILTLLNSSAIVHIAKQTGIGPYGVVGDVHSLAIGLAYAALGLATNFGANPAYDANVIRSVPHQALHRLVNLGDVSFLVNLAILGCALIAAYRLINSTLTDSKRKKLTQDRPHKLSIIMIWTSLAAIASFILTNHYYFVDSRYLTIALFTGFICLATYSRKKRWQATGTAVVGLILALSVFWGVFIALRIYHQNREALIILNQRNGLVAQALSSYSINNLVGDYWRVVPIKLEAPKRIQVTPLANCTSLRTVLTSKSWQPDLKIHGFVYLLSLDLKPTDYPSCTLDQVISAYGRPNKSALIAGTLAKPKELLLFYDHGSNASAPSILLPTPSTVLPITLDELPHTSCSVPSSMNIVAHQDDDLLFMNPDIIHDIKTGHCVRTVYVTAGDSGFNYFYWLDRERGSEAAYSAMLGTSNIWIQRVVKLSDNHYIAVANPKGDSRVSLIFMNLPDGNLKGDGFAASHFESLQKLESGNIRFMHTADNQSTYTSDQLVAAISSLMHLYQPTEVRTQSNFAGRLFPDHSDHMTVGRYAKKAYSLYEAEQFEGRVIIPIKYYIGYPVHQYSDNVGDGDLALKEVTFLAYAKFDGGVCQTAILCKHTPTYDSYLKRQYQNSY